MTDNTIVTYSPSTSQLVVGAMNNLSASIRAAAEQQVLDALGPDHGYSMMEMEAIISVQELKVINGVDLATILFRYQRIQHILTNNLLANHPEQYTTLEEMASKQGISATQLNQTRDLVGIVFPYIENEMGMSIAEVWEDVGKSRLMEILPVMKQLITGENSDRASVRASVEALLDDVYVTAAAMGEELTEAEARTEVARQLLEEIREMPVREIRQRIRPIRTPSIQLTRIRNNGNSLIMSEMTPEQYEMFTRRMAGHYDAQEAEPNEIRRIPEIASLMRLLEAGG